MSNTQEPIYVVVDSVEDAYKQSEELLNGVRDPAIAKDCLTKYALPVIEHPDNGKAILCVTSTVAPITAACVVNHNNSNMCTPDELIELGYTVDPSIMPTIEAEAPKA